MRSSRQSGFTILEVLVAFLLAGLVIAVILSGFSTGLSSLARTGKHAQAALIAQSRLAELGIAEPLEEGEYVGQAEDTEVSYRWQVRVRPFEWGYAGELRERGLEMYRVEIDVFWPATVGEHSYQLVTFRTLEGGRQ